MPRIYRAMFRDVDKPTVGPTKKTLGVQAGASRDDDVSPDANGNVVPGAGGMSVAPAWRDLPPHRIPRRLRPKCPEGAGQQQLCLLENGAGPFVNGRVHEHLQLRVDSAVHGIVEPEMVLPLERFQSALAATREEWVIDEE